MIKTLKNIAGGRPCRQSSINPAMQKNVDGASAAVNVARTGDAAFFTLAEKMPWWEIDLGEVVAVAALVVYNWDRPNATHALAGRSRCRFLQVWGGMDGTNWTLLHDRRNGQSEVHAFGGVAHGPLHVDLHQQEMRFLRLSIYGGGILHLNAVQVLAERERELDAALLDMFLYANERSLKVAARMCSALGLAPTTLMGHAERLGVTLESPGAWFIFNQLLEGGRVHEAQQFLAQEAVLLGIAGGPAPAGPGEKEEAAQAFTFDRRTALAATDPHQWIAALPDYAPGAFAWIDESYRFVSRSRAADIDRRAAVLYDAPAQPGKRIYFCGGCEFSYAGFFLRLRDYEICNTFLDNRSSDPVAQFLGLGGEQLAQYRPDLIILSMQQPFKQFLLKTFTQVAYSQEEQRADLGGLVAAFDRAIGAARRLSPGSKLVLLSHISYSNRMMHLHEEASFAALHGNPLTIQDFVKSYDLELSLLARKHGGLLLDFDELAGKYGKSSADGRAHLARPGDYLGGHPELGGARIIANTIDGWMTAMEPGASKIKLVVLDLDNTMWDGVFREDGLEHITRHIRPAHCYAALHLAAQGILIALCSKNDPEAAEQLKGVLASKFPDLGRGIVAMRVNWRPKSDNIKAIVGELNIGMDSVAFFDDQAFERAEVAQALPQVRVLTDADLLQVGRYAPFIPAAPVSAQGRERAGSYLVEQLRRVEEAKFDAADYGDFLVSCQFQLGMRRAGKADILRVAELFARTNQQNVTLRRTGREFLDSVADDPGWEIWCCNLSDRFGDYGMIGAILLDMAGRPHDAQIVELAFSCRAMGKGLEQAYLHRLAHTCRQQGIGQLWLAAQQTERNQGMIELLQGAGFADAGDDRLCRHLHALPASPQYERWVGWHAQDGASALAQPA